MYIFSDGARNEEQEDKVNQVRKCLRKVTGFKKVIVHYRESNLGLAQNIIGSVNEVVNKYGKAIVLEDDLICSPSFLVYMNKALDKYKEHSRVFSVSAYTPAYLEKKAFHHYEYDAYFNYRNSSWGWGTWADRWKQVDWKVEDFNEFARSERLQKLFNRGGDDLSDMLMAQQRGEIDSWSIRFTYAHFKQDALSLCPTRSLIGNVGFDGSGTNCDTDILMKNDMERKLTKKTEFAFPQEVRVDEKILKSFRWIYERSLYKRIINKLNRYLLSRK
ncbi:glycosyltransferase [Catalinimonas sp. 4WD22]|uniref:glycosyltransferase n=1 Tax=Catalinimonas locisalis TaxID=3133978 RepID=UPI0031010C53